MGCEIGVKNMARHTTNLTGVIYRDSITNGKADKTYYIRYKDVDNKTKEIKIGKFSEGIRENYCNQKRNELLTRIRLGEEPPIIVSKKRKSINSLKIIIDKYFETRKNNGTTKADIGICNHYILKHFSNIDSISKNDLIKWKKYLKSTTLIKSNRPLSIKYRNDILSLLITINRFALKNDLTKNDFSKYITKDPVDNARESFLSKEQIEILYEYTKHEPQLYMFYKIALNTGARLTTVLNISKNHIDFTHKLITLKDFKNNSTYKTFLSDEMIELLNKYIEEQRIMDKLFLTNQEVKLRKILNDLFNNNIDHYDTKNKIVIHTLRHTFASHLAINGTPIYTIQKLMNHSDISMTLRYAKLSPESGRDAIQGLGF